MKKIVLIGIAIILSQYIIAQNEVDVLRYSRSQIGGTARSIGFGGAVGSLGADFASLNVNPAGIGLYQKSELEITPTFYVSSVKASMGDLTTSGFKDNFNLNSVGLVRVRDLGADKGWKYFQISMGLNRINNYNHFYEITNDNTKNSLITDYQNQAYGIMPNELDKFSTDLAWYNFLLDDTIRVNGGVLAYTSPLENGGARQALKKITWGSAHEMSIALGSNFSDIFYIGGSMNFPLIRYFETSNYSEEDLADTIADFQKFTLDQNLETHGSGVNFKLGFIYRPSGFLRMGLAFHSPSYLNLSDEYSSMITRYWDNGQSTKKSSPGGVYDYEITTPMKILGSLTLTPTKNILISGDAEYINYSNGNLKASDYAFFEENAAVRDKYKPTVNLRGGAELKLNPMAFRAGIGYYGSPYQDELNEADLWVVSAGLGYRENSFFFDLGFSYTLKNEDYYLYDSRIIDPASLVYNNYRLALTFGIKY
jgi:hypothetical protein